MFKIGIDKIDKILPDETRILSYLCHRVRLTFEKLTFLQLRLNRSSKSGFFTLVEFLEAILKTLEDCETGGG